ncbi:hypothetical protein SDC9_118503 [bioreactor metagenome]|uniref:Uncharacterized protein n=1 Tax=bioreactor metagenome TaxID=1076179 RepID=A0A645C2U4_9ZZZZ
MAGRGDPEPRHGEQEEPLVLLQYLVGVAVPRHPVCDRAEQVRLAGDPPGLLLHLADRRLGRGLVAVDAASGGDPPGRPGEARIAVVDQQHLGLLLPRADDDDAGRPPELPRPQVRLDRDAGAFVEVGLVRGTHALQRNRPAATSWSALAAPGVPYSAPAAPAASCSVPVPRRPGRPQPRPRVRTSATSSARAVAAGRLTRAR